MIPWLHRIFEAWEDYKQQREREAAEIAEAEATTHAALAEHGHDEVSFEDGDDDDEERRRKKKKEKKKRRKDGDKRRK